MPRRDSTSSDGSITALDYLRAQAKLEHDAREIMPYDPNHCTYHDEPARQQIFACLTCKDKNKDSPEKGMNGVCYSCSIQCHADHDVVELLNRRNFVCDCGTNRMKSFGGCNLRKNFDSLDPPSESNEYNHNHLGRFCSCEREYTVNTATAMFQCLLGDVCKEDWYHEECILGLPPQEPKYQEGENIYDQLESAGTSDAKPADEAETKTMEGLPDQDEFVAFICWKCVTNNRRVVDKITRIDDVAIVVERKDRTQVGEEREEKEEETESKKRNIQPNSEASEKKQKCPDEYSVFLMDGYQEILQQNKDSEIISFAAKYPFLITEEKVYEPPPDDDAASSLLDGGAKALNRLPREKALDGMHAYELLKQRLTTFLRPFADEGKVVSEDDINQFFAQVKPSK
ncbi:hypothetical protein TRVA0_034S01332 [Trichomonascus vanleenenianus]|uniref:uncharacterized protein n=1 Tax=Trichomonascus vanleenenianus TaxID=2268995 RepID=UPI003EC9F781